MKKETLNEVIKYLQRLNDNFKAICEYWADGDYDNDDYEAVREGTDFLIEENNKLNDAIEMLKEIKAVKYDE